VTERKGRRASNPEKKKGNKMSMKSSKYILAVVLNPYANVALVKVDESGTPIRTPMRKWTGTWKDGEPTYRGEWKPYQTLSPRMGGIHYTTSVHIIDATPRDFDDAMAIASSVRWVASDHETSKRLSEEALSTGTIDGWRAVVGA
jgi:hypothetical protein